MTNKEKIRNIIELFIAWNGETDVIDIANIDSAVDFISDSLQVKDVDLDEEIEKYLRTFSSSSDNGIEYSKKLAKYFFELGIAASNPITATDRGTAEEIIVNLKRVEQDYHINLTREMEWLRNQVKKGEEL